ncbi:hypothetical protein ON010_g9509 [Phytophthora cinnamomi]|nr:hypothetical protein ON010_g9509 [Phytophthora cinnamomi]
MTTARTSHLVDVMVVASRMKAVTQLEAITAEATVVEDEEKVNTEVVMPEEEEVDTVETLLDMEEANTMVFILKEEEDASVVMIGRGEGQNEALILQQARRQTHTATTATKPATGIASVPRQSPMYKNDKR